MKLFVLMTIVCCSIVTAGAQKMYAVGGTVSALTGGETLPGASVRIAGKAAAVANEYGFYSLTLPSGKYTMEISATGYATRELELEAGKNKIVDVGLEPAAGNLQQVTVNTAAVAGKNISTAGIEKIATSDTKNIPVLLGERDILKSNIAGGALGYFSAYAAELKRVIFQ